MYNFPSEVVKILKLNKSTWIEILKFMAKCLISPRVILRALRDALSLEGTPREKAKAVAFGIFIAFTPTYGLHTLTVVFFSWIFRLRFTLVLLASWLNNPWTLVPIYTSSYIVGRVLLFPFPRFYSPSSYEHLLHRLRALSWREWASLAPNILIKEGLPFVIGALFLGVVMAIISYAIILKTLEEREE